MIGLSRTLPSEINAQCVVLRQVHASEPTAIVYTWPSTHPRVRFVADVNMAHLIDPAYRAEVRVEAFIGGTWVHWGGCFIQGDPNIVTHPTYPNVGVRMTMPAPPPGTQTRTRVIPVTGQIECGVITTAVD